MKLNLISTPVMVLSIHRLFNIYRAMTILSAVMENGGAKNLEESLANFYFFFV